MDKDTLITCMWCNTTYNIISDEYEDDPKFCPFCSTVLTIEDDFDEC